MNKNFGIGIAVACLLTLLIGNTSQAHGIFKKTLEKKHDTLRVTCNMCHVKGEEKTARNDFGGLFFEKFKGKDLSAKWDGFEGDERKKFEKEVMVPAFLEALEKVYQQKDKDGVKYIELIPNGKMDGTKLKKKK